MDNFGYVQIPTWYHYSCFFKTIQVTYVAQIKGFENLRWDDQQKIKATMDLIKDESEAGSTVASINGDIAEFFIDYAKSTRSKCIKCAVRIEKVNLWGSVNKNFRNKRIFFKNEFFEGAIRVSKRLSKAGSSESSQKIDSYYCLDCFNKAETECTLKAEQ